MTNKDKDRIEVFIAYARVREDEALLKDVENQLSPLERQGLIKIWHEGKIGGGVEWEKEIDKHLRSAPIILLLVSADFIASEKCYELAKRAMERYQKGEAR